MNSVYYLNQINKIERDIVDLQKKIADESKKEITKTKNIANINRSINKNTSVSSLQSKNRQILGYQTEILKCKEKMIDYQSKIAKKNVELGKKKQDLRKTEESEIKKSNKQQSDFQRDLGRKIERQKQQMDSLINQSYTQESIQKVQVDDKQFDFFISHASEDKDELVRELAESLKKEGLDVWYDEFELKMGDSLRQKIDHGLVKSKFGIVIISKNFITKNWPEYELNGMVSREMNGHKVILPIWHKITKDEILQYSPTLADKLAMNTSIHTIEDIVKALKEFI